jgi:hypothetical protein
MLSSQRWRLLKERFTIETLCEELWTMFGPDVPLSHNGPVELTKSGNNPFLTLGDFETGDILINIKGAGGASIGDIVIEDDELKFVPEGGETPDVAVVNGGGAIPGTVVSNSGTVYQVSIFENGITQAATQTVSVTHRSISASSDPVPAGTAVAVFLGNDGTYWMNGGVWL